MKCEADMTKPYSKGIMKILELFSGTESFSKVARELGHQTFTIDFDKSFNPDLCIDNLGLSTLSKVFCCCIKQELEQRWNTEE